MKKKVLMLVLVSMLFAGVASAGTLWGSYKGNAIVKVKSNGKEVKVKGVPAIIYNGQSMIPTTALPQLGLQSKWDSKTQTVNITTPKPPTTQPKIKDLMKAITAKGGDELTYTYSGGFSGATVLFEKQTDENGDWSKMLDIFNILVKTDADTIQIRYIDNGEIIGTIYTDRLSYQSYLSGKLSADEMNTRWYTTGKIYRTPLTAKEIAKLMDRVGVIYTYNESTPIAQGSGFVVSPGNVLITNQHVVEGSNSFDIKIGGKNFKTDRYFFENIENDLFGVALPENLPFLQTETKLPEVGDKVYAIGSPKGYENTLSEGIVSGIRKIDGITYIQHSADIEPGSSGGVLLNEYGDVIGVNTWAHRDTNLFFAVPIKYVQFEVDKVFLQP